MAKSYQERIALEKAEKDLAKVKLNLESHQANLHGGSRSMSLQNVLALKDRIEADRREIKRLEKKVDSLK